MFMQVIQLPEKAWKTPENLVTLYLRSRNNGSAQAGVE
jgi:hypothetical protein